MREAPRCDAQLRANNDISDLGDLSMAVSEVQPLMLLVFHTVGRPVFKLLQG